MFDYFDITVLGLAMDTNMRAQLCVRTLRGAAAGLSGPAGSCRPLGPGSPIHHGGVYRAAVEQYGIHQSMNSDGGRCHDNARVGQDEERALLRPPQPGVPDS